MQIFSLLSLYFSLIFPNLSGLYAHSSCKKNKHSALATSLRVIFKDFILLSLSTITMIIIINGSYNWKWTRSRKKGILDDFRGKRSYMEVKSSAQDRNRWKRNNLCRHLPIRKTLMSNNDNNVNLLNCSFKSKKNTKLLQIQ